MPEPVRIESQGPNGAEVILADHAPLPMLILVVTERDALRQTYFATEMGRRHWERIQAKAPIDIAELEDGCPKTDWEAYVKFFAWGMEEAAGLVTATEGIEPKADIAKWLIRNRKPEMERLRNALFGEDGSE